MSSLTCPPRLTADTRVAFRKSALEALEAAIAAGSPSVSLDLAATVEIDASGLGVLILVQKRAHEGGLRTRLEHATEPVVRLLESTRLAPLFEVVSGR